MFNIPCAFASFYLKFANSKILWTSKPWKSVSFRGGSFWQYEVWQKLATKKSTIFKVSRRVRIASFRLAVGDSNLARSAFVKNRIFFDCQARRASAHLRFSHQKSAIFREWRVWRSFCNKFKARQGKSTGNTHCITEHFDEVLQRIYRKNRTQFESPAANIDKTGWLC